MRTNRAFSWQRLFGRRRRRREERGAILLMAVPGLILALVCTALSVDIGRQVFEKRSDQSVADAAALDASRDPANALTRAQASALRNGFNPAAPGHVLTVQRGTLDSNKVFTAAAAGTAVLVTVSSHLDYVFAPGERTLTARAVAVMGGGKEAGFKIGTTLASLDTTKSPLLNAVLGKWIGGTADVVGWQGLVSSRVKLDALRQQLELADVGVQFATAEQLLAADVTLAKLATATAAVLTAKGDTNAALFAGPSGIIAQMTNAATFKLGDMIGVASGSEASALATEFNAFSLLTGSAMVANGSNAISVPNIGITIANVGTTSLSLKVVEAAKWYVGPDATINTAVPHRTTGQVQLTLTPTLNIPITVAGLTAVTVTGSLPVALTAAGADATLTTITCPNPTGGERVTVDLKPVASTAAGTLVVGASLSVPVPFLPPLVVPVTFNAATSGTWGTDPAPAALDFTYPGDFYSATNPTAAPKRVGASPLGLGAATTFSTTATVGTPPVVPALLTGVLNGLLTTVTPLVGPAVSTALKPILTSLDTLVLKPLLDTLGISIGAADVTALTASLLTTCGSPKHPGLMG